MESKHTCPRIHIAGHRTAKVERNIGYLRRPVAFVPSEHGFRTKQNYNTRATASSANIRPKSRFYRGSGRSAKDPGLPRRAFRLLLRCQPIWVAVGQHRMGSNPRSNRLAVLGSRRSRRAESLRHFHQICKRVGFHFFHHLASVGLYRDLTDSELATDLLVQKSCDY